MINDSKCKHILINEREIGPFSWGFGWFTIKSGSLEKADFSTKWTKLGQIWGQFLIQNQWKSMEFPSKSMENGQFSIDILWFQ